MFLTISMFWQWQNKQHFFFFQADFKSTGRFFEMAFKHCHSRLCSFVSLLIRYVLLANEKHPWGLSNEDKDFRAAWHWPSLKGWWSWGAAGQCSALILQDWSGNIFCCKNKWLLADFEELISFCKILFLRCPKLSSHGEWNPSLCCRVSSRVADQFTPLGGCRFSAQIRSAFHTFCIVCEQVTTKPKKLLWPITMCKCQNSWSPGG